MHAWMGCLEVFDFIAACCLLSVASVIDCRLEFPAQKTYFLLIPGAFPLNFAYLQRRV
jgi:hypothetical protein